MSLKDWAKKTQTHALTTVFQHVMGGSAQDNPTRQKREAQELKSKKWPLFTQHTIFLEKQRIILQATRIYLFIWQSMWIQRKQRKRKDNKIKYKITIYNSIKNPKHLGTYPMKDIQNRFTGI